MSTYVTIAVIAATLFGPVFAVQAQAFLERGRQRRLRQETIFRTLMATRAVAVSPEHVQALNAVPVEFYGSKGKLKDLNDAWKGYLDHHAPGMVASDAWQLKRQELRVELLFQMARILDYKFTRNQLERDIYHPDLFVTMELQSEAIRQGLASLMSGKVAFPVTIRDGQVSDTSLGNNSVG